jgi:CBS domain-containing protein
LVRDALTLDPDDPVIKAATTMAMKKMRRLQVVKDGKLLGPISRGDICKAVLSA